MASNLQTIYNSLAATTVTVGAKTPDVYNLHELQGWHDAADLPARLLLPTNRRNRATSFRHDVMGATAAEVSWQITDLCLWKSVGEGIGLKDVAEDLVTYSRLYADMLVTYRPAVGKNARVSNAEIIVDVFDWPEGSGMAFWGVEAILTITENI